MIQQDGCVFFDILAAERWLGHAFTTRGFEGGAGAFETREAAVGRLRDRFFPGVRGAVWGEQVHGKAVALADGRGAPWGERPGVDALIAGAEGVLLTAFSADCPTVFIADRRARAIGLVHSGRRGTEQGVVGACLDEMAAAFNTSPADCVCAISPSIGPCCYPVDLWSLLEEELGKRGVAAVENPRICTSCSPALFHSYRRERGRCGRMVGAMTVRGGGVERR